MTTAWARRMAAAAAEWLSGLDDEQRATAQWPFPSTAERERWFYTPTDHGGLTLSAMTADQQQGAMRLLAAGLSRAGYVTATTIIALENVLDAHEGFRPPGLFADRVRGRDPGLYYVRVFGDPTADDGTWSWRFGGHHLSVNVAVVAGVVASTSPTFLGVNPSTAPLLGPQRLRPLAAFEDLGRELLLSLDAEQRAAAVLAPAPPPDVAGGNRPHLSPGVTPLPLAETFRQRFDDDTRRVVDAVQSSAEEQTGWKRGFLDAVALSAEPKGVPAGRLRHPQRRLLRQLLLAYVGRLPDDAAAEAEAAVDASLDGFRFAWAGSADPGRPHYYRLQGGDTVVEYDNAAPAADHVHTVWRSVADDFAAGTLARHYATDHG